MKLRRWTPGVVALAALGSVAAVGEAPVRPGVLSAQDVVDKLRVFGTPGDPKLESADAVAVVRRSDGFLVDFWPRRPMLPSSAQFGTTLDVDALWQLHPTVIVGDEGFPVVATRVTPLSDGIETEGGVDFAGGRITAVTRYELSAKRVLLSTRWSYAGPPPAPMVELGDHVRWGNVTTYVDGLAQPRLSYDGRARWVGRRGAGGDLVLRTRERTPMRVQYKARFRGSQGRIHAAYRKVALGSDETVTVERTLAFEPLPAAPPTPTHRAGLVLDVADEAGRPLAAKLRLDRQGSTAPLFGDDGGIDGVDRFVWTGNGHLERDLPQGRYTAFVSAGLEREAERFAFTLGANGEVRRRVVLPRAFPTPGWVGADLHLHQAPSVDADLGLAERVIAIAAEGVELAVASDHYVVTDLAPTVTWLVERGALTAPFITVAGTEVSPVGNRFGHFNVFPLALSENVEYRDTTPSRLFADARRAAPRGLLQVNHPRFDKSIGYFEALELDTATGRALPGYDADFDAVEVYNGDEAHDYEQVRRVFFDWLRLLAAGHRYAATGSSDSHRLAFLDPGLPRTLIRHARSGADDEEDRRASVEAVIAALKAGRAVVSSGPVPSLSLGDAGPGDVARGVGTRPKVHVEVRAASWIDVSEVEVWVGGASRPYRRFVVPRASGALRWSGDVELEISGKSFVVVAASGQRGLQSASVPGTRPFGFTNPLWLEP